MALSDFYLFGYVKRYLTDLTFEDTDALFGAVHQVREGIKKKSPRRRFCFNEWRGSIDVSPPMVNTLSDLKQK
jgi:hypothetical protein